MTILYKYLDERGIDLLINKRILMTKGNAVNDAHDYFFRIDHNYMLNSLITDIKNSTKSDRLLHFVHNIVSDKPNMAALLKSAHENHEPLDSVVANFIEIYSTQFFSDIKQKVGMICLTKSPDNILMWAHYCRNFSGFVVGFDASKINSFSTTVGGPVNYVSRPPVLKFHWDRNDNSLVDTSFLLTKYDAWKYEDEHRYLFDMDKECDDRFQSEGNSEYVLIDDDCIAEVIISNKTSPQALEVIEKYATRKIMRVIPLKSEYGLRIE